METMDRSISKDHVAGFLPSGKPGLGQYSKDSLTSRATAEIAVNYVIKALEHVNYDPTCGRPFTICEYGAADGLSSVCVMTQIIEFVHGKYGDDVSINIIYEDRPTSDFNSLFLALSGGPKELFPSYKAKHQNVFVLTSGRDFFHQCLPNDTLHFAYSSIAMHYLSQRPCQLQDVLQVLQSHDHQERAMFAAQGARDWCTILLHRAKELMPGGQMLLCLPVVDDLGQHMGKTLRVGPASLLDYLVQPWKELILEGLISKEEFAEMSFNSYVHSVEEYAAPFRDQTSAVYRAGLRLVALETQVTPCAVHTEWLKQENKDDVLCRQDFTQRTVAQIRAWSDWLFMQALRKNRSLDESISTLDEFWRRFEQLAAQNLNDIHHDIPMAYIWIEKTIYI